MYLIDLLVAHTTSKSLLNTVHVIVCQFMWPSKIVLLEMFNTLFGFGWKFLRRKFLNLDKNWFDWRESIFENIWNHWHAFHIIKFGLKSVSTENFQVFKIFWFFKSRSIKLVFRLIEKNAVFRLKLVWLDSCFNSSRSGELILKAFSIFLSFSSTNRKLFLS